MDKSPLGAHNSLNFDPNTVIYEKLYTKHCTLFLFPTSSAHIVPPSRFCQSVYFSTLQRVVQCLSAVSFNILEIQLDVLFFLFVERECV